MAELFTGDYWWLWAIALGLALFWPVRHFIWTLYVRRAQRLTDDLDEAEVQRLKRRAGATAAILCFLFALLYAFKFFR
jgi:hypothetical protein